MKKKEKNIRKKRTPFIVYKTKQEENFLEEVKREEDRERKIERMDKFFKTKSSYFSDKIFISINNFIEESWIIEIKANKKGVEFFVLKHKNSKGRVDDFHKDKTFNTLEDSYLYINNHNKKHIKKMNPVKRTRKTQEMERIENLFSKVKKSKSYSVKNRNRAY